jgi:ribosome modulation factor
MTAEKAIKEPDQLYIDQLDATYKQGYNSFLVGIPLHSNPYGLRSNKNRYWKYGWLDAKTESEDPDAPPCLWRT